MKILYRDDDINVYTNAFTFKKLHQQFIDKNTTHTVAILMKDLWENHALFWYLATTPFLEIGLHGWTHVDYSQLGYADCRGDLQKSLDYWKTNVKRMLNLSEVPENKKIKVFFAPWNKEGEIIKTVCQDLNLKFCNIKSGEWEGYKVKSFHWWNCIIDNWKPL